MDKSKIVDALEHWILRVTESGSVATPEEVNALPEIATLLLNYSGSFASDTKNP